MDTKYPKNKKEKNYYLTYKGLLKVLFSSKSGNAYEFVDWATNTLFTAHLGTEEQKEELCSKLLGVDSKTVKNVFSQSSTKTPIVYLFYVGDAKQINDKYSNDEIVCKYGCSADFKKRTGEHEKTYKKMFNKKIELLTYSIIDPKYIFSAEQNISHYLSREKVDHKNEKELIIIKRPEIKRIKEQYRLVQASYLGHYQEMFTQITALESDLKEEKSINEINKLKYTISLNDKDAELNLIKKDMEIIELKLSLQSHNH